MRIVVIGTVLVLASGLGWYAWLRSDIVPNPPPDPDPNGEVSFENVAEKAGIRFHHFDPSTEFHLLPETIGSGVAWIDYDADGWPDLFCIQDGPLPPAVADPKLTSTIFRNNGNGTFTDVGAQVGLARSGYGMGCAVGDYDNDGFDDLVVTYLTGVVLFHNEPDPTAPGMRRFREVTAESGIRNEHWGTSCAWGDLDGDSLLDLYICNYVVIDPAHPRVCRHSTLNHVMACSPVGFPHTHHRLFRNLGGGRFADVSEAAGITRVTPSPGLGVAIADLDGDGRSDIYVANDMGDAYLFRNLGSMKFEDIAVRAGTGLGPDGKRMAGMGIALGDFDGSSRPSLFVTNFQDAPNVLFLNRGSMRFDDLSVRSGLGGPSLSKLGFGTCAFDANLDGNLDLAVANGHVSRSSREMFGQPYAQECQLFLGDGGAHFRDASRESGVDFRTAHVGRGLAASDYDRDGRPDLVLSSIGEPLVLFRNRAHATPGWVNLELVGTGRTSNRNAIGARVAVTAGGKTQHHFVIGGGSYLSASDRRLSIGLADAATVERVVVQWPSGNSQEFKGLEPRRFYRLTEGRPDPETLKTSR